MPQRAVQIAPVGDNLDAIFVGLREFPTKRIVLLAPTDKMNDAKELSKRLAPFKLPVKIVELKGSSILEKMFDAFAALKKEEALSPENSYGEDNIIVNVATGDRISTCAALSASYVNGIKAFTVMDDRVMLLPMLKFSFNKLISEKKMDIIRALSSTSSEMGFDELAKTLKMSAPLLSYHLNGDRDTSGLIELGLTEWSPVSQDDRANGRGTPKESGKKIRLTSMGVLFFNGYCN
jgi:hypothetical protein